MPLGRDQIDLVGNRPDHDRWVIAVLPDQLDELLACIRHQGGRRRRAVQRNLVHQRYLGPRSDTVRVCELIGIRIVLIVGKTYSVRSQIREQLEVLLLVGPGNRPAL